MAEFNSCTTKWHPYAAHVAESRDALKVLIRLEQRYYQRTNYLSPRMYEEDEVEKDDDDDDGDDDSCKVDYVKRVSANVGESRRRSSPSSVDMIAEMASLVTDVRLASPPSSFNTTDYDQIQPQGSLSQRQQEGWTRTPELKPKYRQCKIRNFHSPTSSTDSIYKNGSDEGSLHHQNKSSNRMFVKRRRPTSLEVSCLSNWRHQMLNWTFLLCRNIFPCHGGTIVAVTFNVLDRYLSALLASERHDDVWPLSKQDFQLSCMVSLYIATKLWVPANRNHLTVTTMVAISRGVYSEEIFCSTERDILLALDWHINPPTVMDFCNIYIDLLWIDPAIAVAIRHKCEYLAEIALDGVYFLDKSNVILALTIIILLIDDFRGRYSRDISLKKPYESDDDDDILTAFLRNIQGIVHIQNAEFNSILRRLEYFV
jgi:hypothetical protein